MSVFGGCVLLIQSEMYRNTVSVFSAYLALNKGKEVVKSIGGNIALVVGYPFRRQELFLVCGVIYIKGNYLGAVRLIADSSEAHHTSAVSVKSAFHRRRAYLFGFLDIGQRGDVRRASLHYIKLYGTHFAAKSLRASVLKILGNARIISVTESVCACFTYCLSVGTIPSETAIITAL